MPPETAAQTKPPVDYTPEAIKAAIAHEAANGPAHVRIKALGMMASFTGLFEQARQIARLTAQMITQQAAENLDPQSREFFERCASLDGIDLSDLSMFSRSNAADETPAETEAEAEAEDEEEGSQADDEPP